MAHFLFSFRRVFFGSTFLTAGLLLTNLFPATLQNMSHTSTAMGQSKNYTVVLPANYASSGVRYPVIYWFHGFGGNNLQATYDPDFTSYVDAHNVIIVKWDGTYASHGVSGTTYDYYVAYEPVQSGMDHYFYQYFRELVAHVDANFRTIADRDHRATAGQSMGGYMAPFIAGKNQDLVCATILSCPSPDAGMMGLPGQKMLFHFRELFRSLKGVNIHFHTPSGERYKQYSKEMIGVFSQADLDPIDIYIPNYNDHKFVEVPVAFNWAMTQFGQTHPWPSKWSHTDPWPQFNAWNYSVNTNRTTRGLVALERVSPQGMMVCSRLYVPNGPIVPAEQISVVTDSIYAASQAYTIIDYNRTSGAFSTSQTTAGTNKKLTLSLAGGGHAVGINGPGAGPQVYVIPAYNSEEFWAVAGINYTLSFTLVNVGGAATGPIQVRAFTPRTFISIPQPAVSLASLGSGAKAEAAVGYQVTGYPFTNVDSTTFVSRISLEISCNGVVEDTQHIFIYPMPVPPVITTASDISVLDGRTVSLSTFQNQLHTISNTDITGGTGNGNGIINPGENIVLYAKLAQGLGTADVNTFHPALLVNPFDDPYLAVDTIRYNARGLEYDNSGATNQQSILKISPNAPAGHVFDLTLQVESWNFSPEGQAKDIQRHKWDYRQVFLTVGQAGISLETAAAAPEQTSLEASPNPFNPQTIITYVVHLPAAGLRQAGRTSYIVKLQIFDPAGHLVTSLVDGEVQPGRHQVSWDAKGCGSGMYFARLTAGKTVLNKRLLLIK